MKKTSIILLAYKEPEKFKKMFRIFTNNINKEITPYEVIIIDNQADKEIMDFLDPYLKTSKKESDIKIIHNKKNIGVAKGYNQGAKIASGHYLAFLNTDYYMIPNWLEIMITCFEHRPKIGMISTCTNWTSNANEKVDCTFDGKTAVVELPNDYKESEYAIACMFTTKDILEEVGWFDEYYFVHWEDLDINEAIKKAGYKIFVNRKCFGYHDFNVSKLEGRKKEDLKGRIYFQKKWQKKGWD